MLYATYILPLPPIQAGQRACGHNCRYCILPQRGDIRLTDRHSSAHDLLRWSDYVRFHADILIHFREVFLGLQGEEVLASDAMFQVTEALLQLTALCGRPASAVTNGWKYQAYADRLPRYLTAITFSLDAATEFDHDRERGCVGAFAAVTESVALATELFPGLVTVNTVLRQDPNKAHYLEGMPKLLHTLGSPFWMITPELKIPRQGHCELGEVFEKRTFETTKRYAEEARPYGVQVFLDRLLRDRGDNWQGFYREVNALQFENDDNIFRLSESGRCSIGTEIIMHAEHADQWDRQESPHRFLERLFTKKGRQLKRRPLYERRLLRAYLRGLLPELRNYL